MLVKDLRKLDFFALDCVPIRLIRPSLNCSEHSIIVVTDGAEIYGPYILPHTQHIFSNHISTFLPSAQRGELNKVHAAAAARSVV